MHQIHFRPGLCPRPRWAAYSAPPDFLARSKGPLLSGGRKGKETERRIVICISTSILHIAVTESIMQVLCIF